MATTAGTVLTAVREKGYATDTADAQLSMLNSVHRRVVMQRRWWFREVPDYTTGLTLAANADSTSLAGVTDFAEIDGVRLESGTQYELPEYLPPQMFRDYQHIDRVSGTPEYWTRIDNTLYFWPVADRAYTVSIDYTAKATNLASTATNVDVPDEWIDVLVWGVIKELTFRERDDAGRALAADEYESILAQMRQQDGIAQRRQSSQVVRTGAADEVNYGYGRP